MPEMLQGNNTEARLLADEHFLRKIAHLYYEDGNSQGNRRRIGKLFQADRWQSLAESQGARHRAYHSHA